MKKVIYPISLFFSFQDTIPSGYGYIMLDREFVNWPLFHDDAAWKLFTYLLMRANYTLRLWGTHQVKKGELVTSYQHLAEALNKSRDEIKRLLKKLKDIHEVETVRIGNALLIKLLNYLKYMSLPDKKKGKSARPQLSENPEQIPDENEVKRYVAEKDMDIDLDRFFDHYNANGWCDKKGRRLDGWHFALSRLANHGEWL